MLCSGQRLLLLQDCLPDHEVCGRGPQACWVRVLPGEVLAGHARSEKLHRERQIHVRYCPNHYKANNLWTKYIRLLIKAWQWEGVKNNWICVASFMDEPQRTINQKTRLAAGLPLFYSFIIMDKSLNFNISHDFYIFYPYK